MNGDAEKALEWFLNGGELASIEEENQAEYGKRARPLKPFNMIDSDTTTVPDLVHIPLVRT
jgi:hypothetical protein